MSMIIIQVKRDLLRQVSKVVDRDVVIASSSLRLPLDKVPSLLYLYIIIYYILTLEYACLCVCV